MTAISETDNGLEAIPIRAKAIPICAEVIGRLKLEIFFHYRNEGKRWAMSEATAEQFCRLISGHWQDADEVGASAEMVYSAISGDYVFTAPFDAAGFCREFLKMPNHIPEMWSGFSQGVRDVWDAVSGDEPIPF